MTSTAFLSEDRRFRYWLFRQWNAEKSSVAFIGLNPSTADETADDPTIRRCMGFAEAWGRGGILMLNLYAYRATVPTDMWKAQKSGVDIIGGQRNWTAQLQGYAQQFNCDLVVAAWGRHGKKRGPEMQRNWLGTTCLGLNDDGSPKHPLYLKGDSWPRPYGGI